MKKYFEIIGLAAPCAFLLQDGSRFDLRTGIPNNAPDVYRSGFQHLGLLPGAEVLFKKDKVEELLRLIRCAQRVQDVEILAKAKPEAPGVQEAAEARKKQFSNL